MVTTLEEQRRHNDGLESRSLDWVELTTEQEIVPGPLWGVGDNRELV